MKRKMKDFNSAVAVQKEKRERRERERREEENIAPGRVTKMGRHQGLHREENKGSKKRQERERE